jgi:hypothetical protein
MGTIKLRAGCSSLASVIFFFSPIFAGAASPASTALRPAQAQGPRTDRARWFPLRLPPQLKGHPSRVPMCYSSGYTLVITFGTPLCDAVGIDYQLTGLALADMPAEFDGLLEGQPQRAGVALGDSGRPQHHDIDALVRDAVKGITKEEIEEATKWIGGLDRINRARGVCMALEELWNHRNNVHIKGLPTSELDLYKVEHLNAPHGALLVLMSKLKAWHAGRELG